MPLAKFAFILCKDNTLRIGCQNNHFFEDTIMPVVSFKKKYGKRIGVLGGVDDVCMPGGGYEVFLFFQSLYSMESMRAWRLASMIFSESPTVPKVSFLSEL